MIVPNLEQTATLTLAEGNAAVVLPRDLSRRSYENVKAWLEMLLKMAEPAINNDDEK